MRKKTLTLVLISLFIAVPTSVGFLAYLHHQETGRSYAEQQAALSLFAKANVELGVTTGQLDAVESTLSWLQDYSIFEGAILFDIEMTPILKMPSEYTIDSSLLHRLLESAEVSEGDLNLTYNVFQDEDEEVIGSFLIVFSLKEVRSEQKSALIYTAVATNLIILPIMVALAFVAKRQEKSLDHSLHLQASITHCAMDAIIAIDNQGAITGFNPAAEAIFGHEKKEVSNKNWLDLLIPKRLHDKGPLKLDQTAADQTNERQGRRFEANVIHAEGHEFPAELSVTQVETGQGLSFVAFVRDLTAQKQAEAENRTLEIRMRRNQKMEAVGTMAGGIAHDFNNILGGILGHADLALLEVQKEDKLRNRLQQIMDAGKRARDLVRQMLTFSRQADISLQPILIREVVEEAMELVGSAIPSTIETRLYCEEDDITVVADPTQIHQIIVNTCTNASHALSGGQGVIDVSLDSVEVDHDFSNEHLLLEKNNYARLTIRDSGCGMDEQTISRIFDPFFTTKGVGEGTGLGLSTVHGIVKSYGGAITVHSEVGKGTTFAIYLPQAAQPAEEDHKQHDLKTVPCLQVLLVDDEALIIDVCTLMLEKLGHEVRSFTSSLDALNEFRSNPTIYDLVITDQTMPNMTGDLLVRELLSIRADLLIIMASGFSEIITPELAMQLGARAFLPKPVTLEDLANAIHQTVNQSEVNVSC